jgi:hypothetical protein
MEKKKKKKKPVSNLRQRGASNFLEQYVEWVLMTSKDLPRKSLIVVDLVYISCSASSSLFFLFFPFLIFHSV